MCVPSKYGTGACTRSSRGAGTTGRKTWIHFKGYNKARKASHTAGNSDKSGDMSVGVKELEDEVEVWEGW